jgi:hypothetical protein
MMKRHWRKIYFFVAIALGAILATTLAVAQQAPASLSGQVLGAGEPIANSTVTLWAASAGEPKQLAQGRTGNDGQFTFNAMGAPGKDSILYVVAKGGIPSANKAGGQQFSF